MKQVTQETSKTTSVEINSKTGLITTVALTDAADTGFEFDVTNNQLYDDNSLVVSMQYEGTTGTPIVRVVSRDRFTFRLRVINVGTAVLNAAASISFQIAP